MGNLSTTNLLLGIMAAVSVLEGVLILGVGVAAWIAFRRVMDLIAGLEQRQVGPAMARVNAILDDVKAVSTTVKSETERVDDSPTMDRVEDTAHRAERFASNQPRGWHSVGTAHGNRTSHNPTTGDRWRLGRRRFGM